MQEIIDNKIQSIIDSDIDDILSIVIRQLGNKKYLSDISDKKKAVELLLFVVIPKYLQLLDINTTALNNLLKNLKPESIDEIINNKKNFILDKIIEQLEGV